jgi:hypothetical protein
VTSQVIWSDDSTVALRDRSPAGARLALADVRTGVVRAALVAPDRFPNPYAHLAVRRVGLGERGRPELSVQLSADTAPRRNPAPGLVWRDVHHGRLGDGRFVVFGGIERANRGFTWSSVLSLADGAVTHWLTIFGEDVDVSWLNDGTLLLLLGDTPETYSIYHLLGPAGAEARRDSAKVSSCPFRKISSVAAVVVRNYHGDAWMSKVVRR